MHYYDAVNHAERMGLELRAEPNGQLRATIYVNVPGDTPRLTLTLNADQVERLALWLTRHAPSLYSLRRRHLGPVIDDVSQTVVTKRLGDTRPTGELGGP